MSARRGFSIGRWIGGCLAAIVHGGIGHSLALAATNSGDRVFRAGAAVGDITPELGSMIVGGFNPTPAKHVHDPLQVRALVLDDGAQRLAIVICDNIGLPREVCDEAKRLTRERSGLDPSHVLVAATHTHSGATAGTETSIGPNNGRGPEDIATYQRFIATRVADTVQRAFSQLEPARIGFGRGAEPSQVFNRRWHVTDEALRRNPFGGVDTVRMNPPAGSPALEKPAGPTDPEIPFISIQSRDGRPLALLAAYSLHYVGGVPGGVISADYFAMFCTRIAQLLDVDRSPDGRRAPFVAMLANGTSGDVNNVDFRQKRAPQPPFEQMSRVARLVAAEVYRAYQAVEYHDWVPLDGRLEELTLRARKPTPEMVTRAREMLARDDRGPGWHSLEKSYARRVLQRAEAPDPVQVPVQALRIGDLAIMGTPVETFAEMGLDLKARAPFGRAFTISLANGYFGYMPTPRQLALGGYESWVGTNRLEPEAAPRITAALLRMMAEMRSRPLANASSP